MRKLRKGSWLNNQGTTIVEAMVGFGLVAAMGAAFVGGMVALRNTTRDTVLMSESERQVNDIAENIKAGVESYQVNFNYDLNANEALEVAKLPMAWDSGVVAPKKMCQECAGTYGYIIQPYEDYRGLYKVTLRMTHRTWISKGEPFRDYNFIVSAK